MVSFNLLSTAVMGLLVVATFVAVTGVGRRRLPPSADGSTNRYDAMTRTLAEVVRKPVVWSVVFVVLALGIGAVAVLAVGNFSLPEGVAGSLLSIVYAAVGLLLTGFVFLGAYFGARGRGLGNAQGIAAGSFAAGLVFLVLIAIQLLIGVIG